MRSPPSSRNITLLAAYNACFFAIALYMPFLVLYYTAHGMSMADVLLLQACYAVGMTLFEVPSGYLSDRFSRRIILAIGGGLFTLGTLAYTLATGWWGFFLAEMILVFGHALASGTVESAAYESLVAEWRGEEFWKVWGNIVSYELGITAMLNIIGAFLADAFGMRIPIWIACIVIGATVPLALLLREPPREKAALETTALSHICEIGRWLVSRRDILFLMVIFAVFFALSHLGYWYSQPILDGVGIPLVWFGMIFAGFNLVMALSARIFGRIVAHLPALFGMFVAFLFVAIGYFGISFFFSAVSIVFMVFQKSGVGIFRIERSRLINERVPDDRRATIHSMVSLFCHLAQLSSFSVFALFAGGLTLRESILWLGIFTLIIMAAMAIWHLAARPLYPRARNQSAAIADPPTR